MGSGTFAHTHTHTHTGFPGVARRAAVCCGAHARHSEVTLLDHAKGLDFPMIAAFALAEGVSNQEGICPFSMAVERKAVKLSLKFSCVQTEGRGEEGGGVLVSLFLLSPSLSLCLSP